MSDRIPKFKSVYHRWKNSTWLFMLLALCGNNIWFLVLKRFKWYLTFHQTLKIELCFDVRSSYNDFCLFFSKTLQKSRHVAMGRKKFNMDPKKVRVFFLIVLCTVQCSVSCHIFLIYGRFLQGIMFLVENELLRHTSEDIAQFLYKGEGLNKTAIGDYLGERWKMVYIMV